MKVRRKKRPKAAARESADRARESMEHARAILGAGLTSLIRTQLNFIGIAEELLSFHRLERAETPKGESLFQALRPFEPMEEVRAPAIYEAHCRELLARFKAGEPLAPATDVELICLLLRTSKAAPLNRLGLASLARLATGTPFGEYLSLDWSTLERFEGQADREIADLRRRYAQDR